MIERMALDFARAVPFGFAQGRPGSGHHRLNQQRRQDL